MKFLRAWQLGLLVVILVVWYVLTARKKLRRICAGELPQQYRKLSNLLTVLGTLRCFIDC